MMKFFCVLLGLFSALVVSMPSLAKSERVTETKSSQTGIRYVVRTIDRGKVPDAYIYKGGKWLKVEMTTQDSRMRYLLPNAAKLVLYRSAPTPDVKKPEILAEAVLPKKHSSKMIGLLSIEDGEGSLNLFDEAEYYSEGIHFVSIVPDIEFKLEIDDQEPMEFNSDKPLHLDYRKKPSVEMMPVVSYKNEQGEWVKLGSFLLRSSPDFSKMSIISWDAKRKRPRMEQYSFYDERPSSASR